MSNDSFRSLHGRTVGDPTKNTRSDGAPLAAAVVDAGVIALENRLLGAAAAAQAGSIAAACAEVRG
ncbi:hypothetical protein [Microtetraspora sp. NBRC 16547]|uniref:hypothetical protein n=1 Tax=Microtetraspora sp. NBRC 16547 TaxID=3030993 RepID=UPI0024A4BF57|nr:hypothetical protein [Microtetraspora sp. NBRC 16547]GLX02718.1 hypothetical protein Misp02_68040 [Microtetraspora sp. NBRC 16547]